MENFDTLLGLVKRYSPSGFESEAVMWLVERMQFLGYTKTFVDDTGNAIGIKGKGEKTLLLLGHIDTVIGNIPINISENSLFGRGTVDAKGPLSAFVDAVSDTAVLPGWQLVVIGAVGEEADSTGARAIIPDFNPDYLIVGEPNRWDRIALGYKGNAWTRIVFNQEKSHTASFLKSACENAIDAWEKLRIWIDNYNGEKNKLFDQIQATLRNWSSGDDGFQEWATLDIGVRLPMSFTADDWYETIPKLIPEGDIHPLGMTVNAYTCEKNTPIVRAFLHGIRENQGVPGFVYKTGTSDLNVVAPHWGCPAVVYGPGDSKLDHTPNEHISLEEYQKSVKILSSTFSYLMSST